MCEKLLISRAIQRPVFGWGGWGRSAVYFTNTGKMVETDGMWIIFLGTKGLFGLTLFYLSMVLPAIRFVWQFPVRLWRDPRVAAGTVAAVLLALYMVDCLLNGFVNIIYVTLAGGLMALEPKQLRMMAAGTGKRTINETSITMPTIAGQLALADRKYNLGRTLKGEGRLHEAEAAWRQALNLLTELRVTYPKDPGLQQRFCDCANDLVWLCVNHDTGRRDLGFAVAMAQQLVEECPNAASYWNTLGVAHYRAGDDTAAITVLNHATALGGGTPFDSVFLAMAYARSGDRGESERRLAQAIFLMKRDYPEHSELIRFCDEVRAMLAEGTTERTTVH